TGKIIYNKVIDGRYGAVIQDIESKEVLKELQIPVYDASNDGQYILTLNFSRLGRLRPGYGYYNFPDETEKDLAPKGDGVWVFDTQSSEVRLVIDLHQLATFDLTGKDEYQHYVNHLTF